MASARPGGGVPAGLCDRCAHQQRVPNRRGSVFSLCRLSRVDERFPRYPRLPVLSCPGFRRAPAAGEGGAPPR